MATYHKSSKPLVWLPFAGGGVVAAMMLPVMMLVTGILLPLGILPVEALSYDRLHALAANPLGKIVLAGVLILPLWHGAHRFRCTLQDLGVTGKGGRTLVVLGCYGFGFLFSGLCLTALLAIW